MKAKLNREVAQALTNLRANSDWQVFREWLNVQGANWNQVLIDANNPDTRAIAAGMVRAMNEIVKGIQAAPQTLNEMDQRNG